MLKLRSTGNNGGRNFFLEGPDFETQSSSSLDDIIGYIVSELPDISQQIIHKHQNGLNYNDVIVIEISGGKKFLSQLTDAYIEEHGLVDAHQDEY